MRQEELDRLWDFADAVGSERRIREAIAASADSGERAQLRTQLARALGLQERYSEAHGVLDALDPDAPVVGIRVELERGRLHHSAGATAEAVTRFRIAAGRARAAGATFLLVDALHMLAIADAEGRDAWTADALGVLDSRGDDRTQRWRVGLHNNRGWALFDDGRHAEALNEFELAAVAAERFGTAEQRRYAAEAIEEARAVLRDRSG